VAAARVWPSAWPVVVATLAACVVLALTIVGPPVLEPLFSRFGPLADSALAASLTALAARAGVEVQEILVAQASRKTRKLNAYVSGLGRTRRLVPFVLLLASALGLLASPLGAALSRRWEREADAFSLRLTGDPATFEATHRRLAPANLADLDPPRLAYLTWFSHPTPPERIAGARAVEEAR
jgi:Zn-dependent protease with chaperone function